jgi:hypothetical protein
MLRLWLICLCVGAVVSFQAGLPSSHRCVDRTTLVRRHNFFKNILEQAFENDGSISKDESVTGQIEGPGDDESTGSRSAATLTATQERWRQMNTAVPALVGKTVDMDFYLTGVPNKDPSNDLYGEQVRISDRDRVVGQDVPEEATLTGIRVRFADDETCYCETESAFTAANAQGDWKISDDGKQVRFRLPVKGYTRTVETKGSIQKVFWSDEPEQTRQTSTIYTIPEGWMYGEAALASGTKASTLVWNDGILKIEQALGLLGVASKLTPCGRVDVREVFARSE